MAEQSLPEIDSKILNEALAFADASARETNTIIRKVLEETALDLWRQAHQARRAVMSEQVRQRCAS